MTAILIIISLQILILAATIAIIVTVYSKTMKNEINKFNEKKPKESNLSTQTLLENLPDAKAAYENTELPQLRYALQAIKDAQADGKVEAYIDYHDAKPFWNNINILLSKNYDIHLNLLHNSTMCQWSVKASWNDSNGILTYDDAETKEAANFPRKRPDDKDICRRW